MTKVDLFNLKGVKKSQIIISDLIFGSKITRDLLHQSVTGHLSNARSSTAHTKTRGEVAGSGRKPWKQKGTGRARAGDTRPPNWIGGGISHGPRRDRNWNKFLTKKMRKNAMSMALSGKLLAKRIIFLDKLELADHRTKSAIHLLENLPIDGGFILIVIGKDNPKIRLGFNNLPYVKVVLANSLNVYDIIRSDWTILELSAAKEIQENYFGIKTPIEVNSKTPEKKNPKIAKKPSKTIAKPGKSTTKRAKPGKK